MALLRKLLVLFVFSLLPFIFAKFTVADHSLISEDETAIFEHGNDAVLRSDTSDESLKLELDQLKSKISSLETRIEEKVHELRSKDKSISQLEKIVEEKLSSLGQLQNDFKLLQEKGSLHAKEQLGKSNAHAKELEKQIVSLKREIEAQNTKKQELEARGVVAEEKIERMNSKLQDLERINNEQQSKIHKTQHALQVAEEEMLKAKLEASSVLKQLKESFVMTHWNKHARPALDQTIEKALEKKSEFETWAYPHFETFKTKWVPTIKDRCVVVTSNVKPLVQSLATKVTEFYHLTKSNVEPRLVKMQENVDPYFQETKVFIRPFVDQVSVVVKPHFESARVLLKPYSKRAVRYCNKIKRNIRMYHSQVQANLHGILNSHELTKSLATKELVRFMATFLMVLPVVMLIRLFIWKQPETHARKARTGHTRWRAKRIHHDK